MVSCMRAKEVCYAHPGPVQALAGVSLVVEKGTMLAVVGPNGSGKSTLLRILAGLLRPDRGLVEFDGTPVADISVRLRARRIAVVPQGMAVIPEMKVEAFVAGGRYAHQGPFGRPVPGDREAIARALAEADVTGLEERLLSEISGGQRQRVLVARALAQEAAVVLLDEPTTSLDPSHRVEVFALVRRLADSGRAIVLATHDLPLAGAISDRMLLLDEGRQVAQGVPAEVLTPEVLRPVYGDDLAYLTAPGDSGAGAAPLVLPWPAPGRPPGS